MISTEQQLKINLLFRQISNLESSDSSTMTELSVCEDLVSQKFDIDFSYLDICCGKGTILLCLYIEFWKNLNISDIEEKNKYIIDRICGVDISKAQVDISKNSLKNIQKIFKIQNILDPFIYNYNIISDKNNVDKLEKKYTAVITNPPYNSERGNNNQSVDIYPEIVDKAVELADRYVIMITKSNWMNKPSMRTFREKMINQYNVDKIVHYPENPFKGADIKGGVSYFVIDNQNTKETFKLNGVSYDRKVAMDFLPYMLNINELEVLSKIKKLDKINLSNYRPKGFYKIKSNDSRLINEFIDDEYIKCYVSNNNEKFINKSHLSLNSLNDLNKCKIYTSSSAGDTINPYVLGNVKKCSSNTVCNESLVCWVFDNNNSMDKWYSFMNTELFRFCISCIKTKHDVSKNSFSLIPNIPLDLFKDINDESINKYLLAIGFTDKDLETISNRVNKYNLLKKEINNGSKRNRKNKK